jgi:hypothetical protein
MIAMMSIEHVVERESSSLFVSWLGVCGVLCVLLCELVVFFVKRVAKHTKRGGQKSDELWVAPSL